MFRKEDVHPGSGRQDRYSGRHQMRTGWPRDSLGDLSFLKEQLVCAERLEGEGTVALVQRWYGAGGKIQRSYKADPAVSDKGQQNTNVFVILSQVLASL